MFEANYDSKYEYTGFNRSVGDTKNLYIRARLAEQSDRHHLLDKFHSEIIRALIGLHIKMEQSKYPDSFAAEMKQLKDIVDSAIENAHSLSNEIAPHVLFRSGLQDALHELFRRYVGEYNLRYYVNLRDADLSLICESTNLVIYNLVNNLISGTIQICDADIIGVNIKTTDNTAEIVIHDNGSVSSEYQKMASIGQSQEPAFLVEAAEQVHYLGGQFWIDKAIGMRTIYTRIPLVLAGSSVNFKTNE